MYYFFLVKSLFLFFINIFFLIILSQTLFFLKVRFSKLNLIILLFLFIPICISLFSLAINLFEIEVLFTYLVINFTFIIIYPGLDYNNIPSLKILAIIKNFENKYKKPCPKILIRKDLEPNKIFLKRIGELRKDKFVSQKKNNLSLNLIGKIFASFFSIVRIIYNIKGGKG